jgi:hypothetical protein
MAIFGGELLTFALYKIGKAKYQPKENKEIVENIEESENNE